MPGDLQFLLKNKTLSSKSSSPKHKGGLLWQRKLELLGWNRITHKIALKISKAPVSYIHMFSATCYLKKIAMQHACPSLSQALNSTQKFPSSSCLSVQTEIHFPLIENHIYIYI